jgi:hypothetical protein
MRRFWKRRREDEIEQLLRANRAEPRDEFVNSVLGRLEGQRPRFRPQRSGRRILVATVLTALAASAAIAAGGAHVAGTSLSSLVRVAQSGVNGADHTLNRSAHQDKHGSTGGGADGNGDNTQSAAEHQYSVEVCHHTHSATNPWVPLFLRPPGAAAHLKHHSGDYVVGASGNPSTCPP